MESRNKKTGTSLLSRIGIQELKLVKTTIVRHGIIEPHSPQPILRNLDDPADLLIHIKAENQRPIFDRDDIEVNQEIEKRVILKTSLTQNTPRSTSCRRSRREKSKTPERARESRSVTYEKCSRRSRSQSSSSTENSDRYSGRCRTPLRSYRRRSTPLRPGEYRPPKKRTHSPRECKAKKDEPILGSSRERHAEKYSEREKRHSRSPLKSGEKSSSPYRRNSKERRSSRPSNEKERLRTRSPPRYSSRRTPSPLRHRYRSKRCSRSPPPSYHSQSNVLPTPQYKDGGLWIPDAILAQGYMPGLFGPPRPRPMIWGPRPLIPPMIRPGVFPPRPPKVYNQPYRPRISVPTVPVTSTIAGTTSNSSAAIDTTSKPAAES